MNFESFNFNLFLEIFFRGTYESSKDSNFRFDVRKRLSQNFNQCLSYLLDLWWEEWKKILVATRNCWRYSDIEAIKLADKILGTTMLEKNISYEYFGVACHPSGL